MEYMGQRAMRKEIERLYARIAELEAKNGESIDGITVPRFLVENYRNLTNVPRYQRILDACLAAHPAPRVDTDKARLYEELRAVIDGGSESMTHADAIREIRWLQDFAERESEA